MPGAYSLMIEGHSLAAQDILDVTAPCWPLTAQTTIAKDLVKPNRNHKS